MIVVLASPCGCADFEAVAGKRRCILTQDQDELLRLAGEAQAVVLEAPDPLAILAILRDIKREHPFLPVVLVTDQNSANVQRLASVPVEAVFFQHQSAARLLAPPRESTGTTVGLRVLGDECIRNEAIPAPLRYLLARALTSLPPPCSVRDLARLMNSDPSTIRRHWRSGVSSHGIPRVKDLLGWLVLLRAVSVKRPGLSWRSVAKGVGAHESTLRRTAQRLTGDTLGSLHSVGVERLLERFTKALDESLCAKMR